MNEYECINPVFKLLYQDVKISLENQQEEQRKSVEAFDNALAAGILSTEKGAKNYVHYYMYMGKGEGGKALFKHISTRAYLKY